MFGRSEWLKDLRGWDRVSHVGLFLWLVLLIGCAFAGGSPTSAIAASTCPGRNGKLAVITQPAPERSALALLGNDRLPHTVLQRGHSDNPLSNPSFSCDGSQVVLTESGGNPSRALVVVDLATRRAHQVPTAHLTANSPSFLTSGAIVFSGSRGGRHPQGGTYEVRPNGSRLRRLLGREALSSSADGRWFVATDPAGHFRTLYLLNAKGRAVHRLTPTAPAGTEYLNPRFSPTGGLVVFERRRFGQQPHSDLYVVRRDGTHLRRLTRGSESCSEPIFSPDGKWIAFTRAKSEGPAGNVFALSLADPKKIRKFGLSSNYRYPAWAPR